METIFMNIENSKTNETKKFVLNFSQRLNSISSDKHVALQNLSIYYTWNNKFELSDGSYSVSDIRDYIEFIIEKYETLTTNIYINRINNRLVFKIKDEYKLELQAPETMKLFGSTKNLIEKRKNREKVLK